MASNPIVIGYHIMWTLYGWWLPNDPRGSTSRVIRNDILADLGELHHGRRRAQPAGCAIRSFYNQAEAKLQHELLSFHPDQFPAVAESISAALAEHRYTCYAAAIMPDHVHLLIRKHRDTSEQMIENIQKHSRLRLRGIGLRPPDHPTWTRGGWKVFLDHPDDVCRPIAYIEKNPVRIGLPAQPWAFVQHHDGWPLHPGHSPNSPYVRALKAAGRYPR